MIKRAGNIYEQQQKNDGLTVLLVAIFILYYLILGYGTDVFIFRNDLLGIIYPSSEELPYTTIVALLLAGTYVTYCFYRGDDLVLSSVSIKKVWWYDDIPDQQIMKRIWQDDEVNKNIVNVVHEMSIAAGVPMPAVYVVIDPDPNAFSTGRDPWHASIAITTGLLKKMEREELQAVIAHEMAHIRNYDIRLMMLVATLMGASSLLSAYTQMRWLQSLGMFRRILFIGSITAFFFIWVGMVVLAPLISHLLTVLISHEREYQADATAAELTRNPIGVLKTLEKLDLFAGPTWSINPSIGHLCMVSPMGKYLQMDEDQTVTQRVLFNSHPTMEKRINAIKAMGYITNTKPSQIG